MSVQQLLAIAMVQQRSGWPLLETAKQKVWTLERLLGLTKVRSRAMPMEAQLGAKSEHLLAGPSGLQWWAQVWLVSSLALQREDRLVFVMACVLAPQWVQWLVVVSVSERVYLLALLWAPSWATLWAGLLESPMEA